MQILKDIIPESARKYVLYVPYALLGLVLGVSQVAGAEALFGVDLETLFASYAFVGTAMGLTAYSNTGTLPKAEQYISDVTDEDMIRVTKEDGSEEHFQA